jgi:replicative DNA helicase
MLDKDAAYHAVSELKPGHFYKGSHQKIFDAIKQVLDREGEIDHVLVREELRELGILEEIGGLGYLTDLVAGHVTAATIEQHCSIVIEKARKRASIQIATALVRSAYEPGTESTDLISEAVEKLMRVSLDRDSEVSLQDAAKKRRDDLIYSRYEPGYKVTLDPFDSLGDGLHRGRYHIIGGGASVGKSTTTIKMISALAEQGLDCLYFSMEMDPGTITDQMVRVRSGLNIVNRCPSEDERKKAILEMGQLAMLPGEVTIVKGRRTIRDVCAITRARVSANKCQICFIDYVGLIRLPSKENRQIAMAGVSGALKGLAESTNIPLVVLSQFNRDPAREKRRPTPHDLRDSGALENDADLVYLLHRPNKFRPQAEGGDDGLFEIILAKNRFGLVGEETYYVNDMTGEYRPAYMGASEKAQESMDQSVIDWEDDQKWEVPEEEMEKIREKHQSQAYVE